MIHHSDPAKNQAVSGREQERHLIQAVQRGDSAAFRELYDDYRERIYNLVAYSIGDPLQTQDVLQTIFLKVFRGLANFRFQSSLSTWIYRIAHNECHNHHRTRRATHVPLEAILGSNHEMDTKPISHEQHVRKERETIIQQTLMQLPFKMREVVVLKYIEGLSYEEMGRILRCAPGTVASRLNRALTELEERLRPLRRML